MKILEDTLCKTLKPIIVLHPTYDILSSPPENIKHKRVNKIDNPCFNKS